MVTNSAFHVKSGEAEIFEGEILIQFTSIT